MITNKPNKTRGQSLVEMGLTLPILLLLIFTFIDLGRAVYYSSALGNAVREGARFASVQRHLDTTPGTQHYNDTVAQVTGYSVAVPISATNVTRVERVDELGNPDVEGDYVIVSASFFFDPVTPFLEKAFGPGNEIKLSSESTMYLTPYAR